MVEWGQWCTGFELPQDILMPVFVDVLFVQWLGGVDANARALDALLRAQVQVIHHLEVHGLPLYYKPMY
jgi:hypothetical protein